MKETPPEKINIPNSVVEGFLNLSPIEFFTLAADVHGQSLGILLFLFLVLIQSRSYAVNDP